MGADYGFPARKKWLFPKNKQKNTVGVLHAPSSTPDGTCLIEILILEQKGKMVRKLQGRTKASVMKQNFPPMTSMLNGALH